MKQYFEINYRNLEEAKVKLLAIIAHSLALLAGKAQLDRMAEVHAEEGEDADSWDDIDDFAEMVKEDALKML